MADSSHADADTQNASPQDTRETDGSPRKKVIRRRRKSWEFEIVLCEDLKPNE
jgi:hypothetical protein